MLQLNPDISEKFFYDFFCEVGEVHGGELRLHSNNQRGNLLVEEEEIGWVLKLLQLAPTIQFIICSITLLRFGTFL